MIDGDNATPHGRKHMPGDPRNNTTMLTDAPMPRKPGMGPMIETTEHAAARGFATRAIHAATGERGVNGPVVPSIEQSATFRIPSVAVGAELMR